MIGTVIAVLVGIVCGAGIWLMIEHEELREDIQKAPMRRKKKYKIVKKKREKALFSKKK